MALKIIDGSSEEQSKKIAYPCIMEYIVDDGTESVVLAISECTGILLISNRRPEDVGKLEDDWISFEDSWHWKPYDKPVTFCNA